MLKVYPSKRSFILALEARGFDKFKLKESLYPVRLNSFVCADGSKVVFNTVQDLCEFINTDQQLIDPASAKWAWGLGYTISFVSNEPKKIVEKEVFAPVVEEVIASPVEETVEPITEVASPDFDKFEDMEDSKENRLVLDEYAETFNIKLRRNMKLANMLKKFKEEWTAQQS